MSNVERRALELESPPLVRGILVLSHVAFLREQGGSTQEQLLAELGPADAAVLRASILPDAWYPLDLHDRIDDAIAAIFSHHDRADVLVQLGHASADAMLAGSERRYMKDSAGFLLEAVPRLYGLHYKGSRLEYERLGPNAGLIRAFDAASHASCDPCWTLIGWLQRVLELSGAEAVLVNEISCRGAGAPHCEYRCEWHG